MASRGPDQELERKEEMALRVEELDMIEVYTGPANKKEADYSWSLDQIMDRFHQLLRENKDDALLAPVRALQNLAGKAFREMCTANINIVMDCVKDPRCTHLRDTCQSDTVQNIDPDAL